MSTMTARLLRRGWRATVLLALFCGLAAGVAMAAIAAGRHSTTTFDRFLAFAEAPDLVLNVCPPDITELTEEAIQVCSVYAPEAERDVIEALPEVEEAVITSFRGVTVAAASAPGTTLVETALLAYQPVTRSLDGRHLMVEGRWYDPDAVDEVVVNERLFADLRIELGEYVDLTSWGADELGRAAVAGESFTGERLRARVVGVSRGVGSLGDNRAGATNFELSVLGGPGVVRATPETQGFIGLLVHATSGDDVAAEAAIQAALPDMLANISAALEGDETNPIRDAIRYEAYGVMAFGALAATAAAVFAGQAVARQTRREWLDLPTLRALGVTDAQARRVALGRAAVVAALGIVVAGVTAVVLSPLGSVGVARRAETDPGPLVDGVVLALGGLAVAGLVVGTSWMTVRRPGARRAPTRWGDRPPVLSWVGPSAAAGLAMGRRARTAGTPLTAVAGGALAVLAITAAIGSRASLDGLHAVPARIGAPWDVSLVATGGDPRYEDALDRLGESGDVDAAAAITGTDVDIEDQVLWLHAFVPLEGFDRVLTPPILTGRAPTAATEIALGEVTMRDLGLEIGDTVEIGSSTTQRADERLTIVGTAIVNDTYEPCGGCGGVVAPAFIETYAPEAEADPLVFRYAATVDSAALTRELDRMYPGGVLEPIPQQAVRNLDRLRGLPLLLAALASALALASMAHALTLSVRHHRPQLAVLRCIGFTRGQVRAAVATHAASLAVLAAIVGVPLGLVVARQGWRLLVSRVGVAYVPKVPVGRLFGMVLLATAVVVGVALVPGWWALRTRPSAALRVE